MSGSGFSTKKKWHLFIIGGLSHTFGEFVTLPVDVIKVRMQIDGAKGLTQEYRGLYHTFTKIVQDEGWRALYNGLTPAVMRQVCYGGIRIGLYEPIKILFNSNVKEELNVEGKIPAYKKVGAAICSGAIAAAICNPIDVVKIRMQAEVFFRSHYNNTFSAFGNIARKEGLRGLYNGWFPTSQRAAIIAVAEIATYDEAKHFLISRGNMRNETPTHLLASLLSGFVATLFCSPFDFIKTRLQSQPIGADGRGLAYRGALHCIASSIKREGLLCLWKGMWPHYLRRGPHVVISFFALEQLRRIFEIYL